MKNVKISGILSIAIGLFACNKVDQSPAAPMLSQNESLNGQANNAQQPQTAVSTKSGAISYIVAFKTDYPYADGRKLNLQEAEAVGLDGVDKGLAEMKNALGANLGTVDTVSTLEAKVKATLTIDEVGMVRTLSRVVWVVDATVGSPDSAKVGGIDNDPAIVSTDPKTTNFPITKDISLAPSSSDGKTSIMPLTDIKIDSQSATSAP